MAMMNPFTEHFNSIVGSGAPGPEMGSIYKSVLHQRGYGFGQRPGFGSYRMKTGFGWNEALAMVFKFAKPLIARGLKYLGKRAVATASSVAQDAFAGENILSSAKKHITETASDVFAKAPGAIVSSILKGSGQKRKGTIQQSSGQLVASARQKKRKKTGRGLLKTYPTLHKIG